MRIRFQVDAAAIAAVAAGRPAARHEFFAAKRDASIAAIAGLHVDFRFVDKYHGGIEPFKEYDSVGSPHQWRML